MGSLILASCGGDGEETGNAEDVNIAAVIKGLDNPFFQSMQQGIEDRAGTSGATVNVQAATSLSDTTGQADKLTSLAGQNFDCYIVNPVSGSNLVQPLAGLATQGKPIVNIDQPIDDEAARAANLDLTTYIGTDNTAAGRMAGEEMARLLPAGSKVALIGGIPGDVTSGQRLAGFQQGIDGKLTVVQTVAAHWERQQALTRAGDILRSNSDLMGFFAANDDMGLGIVRAVADANRSDTVKVISVDGVREALESVKAGGLTATVAQYPYTIGQLGVQACEAAAAGKTLPETIVSPVELVTSETVDRALAATPKPFGSFENPLTELTE